MNIVSALFRRTRPAVAAPLTNAAPVPRGSPVLGVGKYNVFDAPSGDVPGGPTHQPGVMPGHGYEALRTPFGQTGVPGAGRERNLTDLDLAANQHPDGYAFADSDGRGTNRAPRPSRRW